jgi:hypothetical protein
MGRRLTKRDLKELERDEFGTTSPVYRYIRDSYAELAGLKVGRPGGPSWESFAQLLARRGQTNGKGERLTADTARKLFRRVSAEMEARPSAASMHPMPAHRSRQRGDWSPPERPPSGPSRNSSAAASSPPSRPDPAPPTRAAAEVPASSPLDDLPPEAKAKIDRLRQAFAETDRKRFGRF